MEFCTEREKQSKLGQEMHMSVQEKKNACKRALKRAKENRYR